MSVYELAQAGNQLEQQQPGNIVSLSVYYATPTRVEGVIVFGTNPRDDQTAGADTDTECTDDGNTRQDIVEDEDETE